MTRTGATRLRRLATTSAVVLVLLGAAGLAAACTAPPATCPPAGAQQQVSFPDLTGANPWQSLFDWLAHWWWLSPRNCGGSHPEQPPSVVPESPVAVLVPLAAVVTAGFGLVVVRSRRAGPDGDPATAAHRS